MTTVTVLSADLLRSVADAAAEAIASLLPSANGGWTAEAVDTAAPLTGGQAVTASIDGIGTLSLVVLPRLGRQLQVGPPPAEDLLDGATPALQAAAQVIGRGLGSTTALSGPTEADAARVEAPGPKLMASVVHLLDGGEHAATMILAVAADLIVATAAGEPMAVSDYAAFEPTSPTAAADVPVTVLHDVELGVTVELGRTKMLVRDVLALTIGSVVELDRTAGSPVDVYVNGTLIARGEVVVVDEEFGVRISEVVGYQQDRTKR